MSVLEVLLAVSGNRFAEYSRRKQMDNVAPQKSATGWSVINRERFQINKHCGTFHHKMAD